MPPSMIHEVLNNKQAAKVLGISYGMIARLIARGILRSWRHPINRTNGIRRADLIAFMQKHHFPPEMWRGAFSPPGGWLLWMGRPRDLDWGALSMCDPRLVSSPYRLGQLIATTPVWGVVFDMQAYGITNSMRIAEEIASDPGGPLLIALTNSKRESTPAKPVFDKVVQRPFRSARNLARQIIYFRDLRAVFRNPALRRTG